MTEDIQAIRRLFRDIPMCRVATVRPDGGPHVAPRWFVWLDDAIWVATRVGDTTWEDALRDPRLSVLIDRGRDWNEPTGGGSRGVAELMPAEHPDLRAPMSAWHDKYRTLVAGEGFERLPGAGPIPGVLLGVARPCAPGGHPAR